MMKIPRKQMDQAENEAEREDSSVLSMTELSLLRNYYALAPSRIKAFSQTSGDEEAM